MDGCFTMLANLIVYSLCLFRIWSNKKFIMIIAVMVIMGVGLDMMSDAVFIIQAHLCVVATCV